MYYYDKDGQWTINASATDNSNILSYNDTTTLSYGQLQAVMVNKVGISFENITLAQTSNASNNPLILDNTGNQNFTQMNITAFDLVGMIRSYQYVPANSFYINTSDSIGYQLSNNTKVNMTIALPRDINSIDQNASLYFWIVAPSSGLSRQNYTSSSWVINVGP
jgi:hypothetical protein